MGFPMQIDRDWNLTCVLPWLATLGREGGPFWSSKLEIRGQYFWPCLYRGELFQVKEPKREILRFSHPPVVLLILTPTGE